MYYGSALFQVDANRVTMAIFTNDDVRKPSNEEESFQEISKRQNIGNPVAYCFKINLKK